MQRERKEELNSCPTRMPHGAASRWNPGQELRTAVTIKARFQNFRRRLRRDGSKGSAAIEFAMVAPVFFLLLMGTIEAGIIFFAQSSLQNALNDAARLVRT